MKTLKKPLIFLDEKQALSVEAVGGKAAGLAALRRAGYPVPPGICVTTAAFKQALRPYQIPLSVLLKTPNLADNQVAIEVAAQINELLRDLFLPVTLRAKLFALLPQIRDGDTAVAVRSSGSDEDGDSASFAGQYATFLGVQGDEAIEQAILDCWRSFFSAHALAHRVQTHKPIKNAGMAVLLQPFIDAECSGVAYSVDPVAQVREHVVVNSVWGLGLGVVDGDVANDVDWVDRTNWRVVKRHIVVKPKQIKLDDAGHLQRLAVPDGYDRSACLPESWLKRVAQFVVTLEQLFQRPQDVEWTVAGQQLWILQSRSQTALPPELAKTTPFPVAWQDKNQFHLWRLAHYEAHQQGAPLPLEYDHFKVQESIREEACRLMGVERHVVMKGFNGRPYFRDSPIEWTEADRRLRNQVLEDQRDRLFNEGCTVWEIWGPEIVKSTERLRAFDFARADGIALAGHLEEALAAQRRHALLHPLCVWRPRAAYFEAYTAVSGNAGPEAENAATKLLDGGDTPLTNLIDALYELGCTARSNPALTALLHDPPEGSTDELLAHLLGLEADKTVAAFQKQFADLLTVYGERVGYGYGSHATVNTPTWSEQPAQVLRLAAVYLDPAQEAPAVIRARTQKEREDAIAGLCAACDDERAVAEFKRLWRNGCRWWTVLETHNHYIDQMACGQLRHAVMAAARWLVVQGSLAQTEAVFWLTFAEIGAALRSNKVTDFTAKIKARRTQHAAWTRLIPPSILGMPEASLPKRPALTNDLAQTLTPNTAAADAKIIKGLGASPGQVTGRARVMVDEWAWPDVAAGDILVARNVGPRWTPLFPLLGGLVLDSGSIGQHAAATAREYGVTAVIAAGNATRRISDGSAVWVDGANGIVRLLEL